MVREYVRQALTMRRVHASDFEERVVWIFGAPRTGSTWLLLLLGEHDAIVPVNEPLIGWHLGPFLCDLPGGRAGGFDATNFTVRRVQRYNQDFFFSEQFRDVWLPALGRLARERLFAHAQRYPSRAPLRRSIVVVKEPNGSQSADLIMQALPRSRLLFLLRDGRDVVDSELAANLEGSWVSRQFPGLTGISEHERLDFVIQSAHKWLWRTDVVEAAFRAHKGSKYLVRYEDLIADPAGRLRAILDWLDLAASDQELESWIDRNHFDRLSGGKKGPREFLRAANPGAWRSNLRPEEQEAVHDILGAKLVELGYDGAG